MSAGQPRPEPPRIVLDDLYVLDRPRAEDAAANRRFALDTDAARFLGWTVDQARSLPDATTAKSAAGSSADGKPELRFRRDLAALAD